MKSFPDGFLWGAASSAHQTEGNNVNSDWWHNEYAGESAVEPSGDAVDSYHRYREDMELLGHLIVGSGEQVARWWLEHPELSKKDVAARFHAATNGAIAAVLRA